MAAAAVLIRFSPIMHRRLSWRLSLKRATREPKTLTMDLSFLKVRPSNPTLDLKGIHRPKHGAFVFVTQMGEATRPVRARKECCADGPGNVAIPRRAGRSMVGMTRISCAKLTWMWSKTPK